MPVSKHDLKHFFENLHATLDSQLSFFHGFLPLEGDLATKLYASDKENNNDNTNKIIFRFKILLIDYLNELIDFSMSFPFYRRLNPLFDELFNKDTTLSIGRSIFARARVPPGRWAPARARKKNASTNW